MSDKADFLNFSRLASFMKVQRSVGRIGLVLWLIDLVATAIMGVLLVRFLDLEPGSAGELVAPYAAFGLLKYAIWIPFFFFLFQRLDPWLRLGRNGGREVGDVGKGEDGTGIEGTDPWPRSGRAGIDDDVGTEAADAGSETSRRPESPDVPGDSAVLRASAAVTRGLFAFALVFSLVWAGYLLASVAWVAQRSGPFDPVGPDALLSTVLLSLGILFGSLVFVNGLLVTAFFPAAKRVSLEIQRRSLPLPRLSVKLLTVLLFYGLCLGLAPSLWIGSLAYREGKEVEFGEAENRAQDGAWRLSRTLLERLQRSPEPDVIELLPMAESVNSVLLSGFIIDTRNNEVIGARASEILGARPDLLDGLLANVRQGPMSLQSPRYRLAISADSVGRYIAGSISPSEDLGSRFLKTLLGFGAVVILGVPIVLLFAVHSLAGPIREIALVVNRIARSPNTWPRPRAPVFLDDEVGRLAKGVNAMLQRLAQAAVEERRSAGERERLLREEEARSRLLETIIEKSSVAIALAVGPEMVIEVANPAYRAIAPGKKMLGRCFFDVWSESPEDWKEALHEVFRNGGTYQVQERQFQIRRSETGPLETAWFSSTHTRVELPDGRYGILGLASEVTDEVKARERIAELAAMAQRKAVELETVLDTIVDAVFAVDARRRITVVNSAGRTLLGLSESEEDGGPLSLQVFGPGGRLLESHETALGRALAGQTVPMQDEAVRNVQTGELAQVRTSAAPIRDGDDGVAGAVLVMREVGREFELEQLKNEFLRVAAHELKTPVTLMKGYSQVLLRESESEREGQLAPRRRMLAAIDRGADRISRIVNELLDISQLQLGRLSLVRERVELSELVQAEVDRVALNSPRHRIRVLRADPVAVHGDRLRLGQLLSYLLDNAVKYSPEGGDVDVELVRSNGEARITIRDHGVGIPRDKQGKLFERFYRAHTDTPYDYGGMGVGLYIAREIVVHHGGRIRLESTEGKGTTVEVVLPAMGGGESRG